MHDNVIYETLAKLHPQKPVERIGFIANECTGLRVLDIGCFDETALEKRGTGNWLHERIAANAESVLGIDNSIKIPKEGIITGENSRIHQGNALELDGLFEKFFDVIVAGEFIEHIDHPIAFIHNLKNLFPGTRILLSTPNGVSFANTLLGMISREAQHPDHVHVFTYKILNTICLRAGLADFKIIPYSFYATEMILKSAGVRKSLAKASEIFIRPIEKIFPLLSFGYIIDARL